MIWPADHGARDPTGMLPVGPLVAKAAQAYVLRPSAAAAGPPAGLTFTCMARRHLQPAGCDGTYTLAGRQSFLLQPDSE
jgi:hypothetical protein